MYIYHALINAHKLVTKKSNPATVAECEMFMLMIIYFARGWSVLLHYCV